MIQAYRDKLRGLVSSGRLAHSGLVLHRLLPGHPERDDKRGEPDPRGVLLKAACDAQGNARDVYRHAFVRRNGWLRELSEQGTRPTHTGAPPRGPVITSFSLATPGGTRLIIGLGGESPLETGLTLHHTFGVPIIPGSAIKGLAAHYCDQVFGDLPNGQELHSRVEFTDETGKPRVRTGKQFLAEWHCSA